MCRKVRGRYYFPQKVQLASHGLTLVTGCQGSWTQHSDSPHLRADCRSLPVVCLFLTWIQSPQR